MNGYYVALAICLLQFCSRAVEGALADGQPVSEPASWRSCSNSAAFQIAAVDLQPSSVVPPGGQLSIIIDGTNTQQITAGTATVTVWYWGVPVLTASDTLCTATANPVVSSKHRKLLDSTSSLLPSVSSIWGSSILLGPGVHQGMTDDATCTMVPGPLHLTHAAQLPGIAPKGRYSMRLAAADMVTGQQIMCLDVWFRVG